MKNLKLILLLVAISVFSVNGFSQNPHMMHNGGKGMHMERNHVKESRIENRIPDLTDTQKEKIKTERTKLMKEILPLKNELNEKQAHLKTLTSADKVNMNAVNSTIDEIGVIKTNMMKKRAEHKQNIRGLLTDSQRVTFDMHSQMNKKHKMGKMHHKGNCPK